MVNYQRDRIIVRPNKRIKVEGHQPRRIHLGPQNPLPHQQDDCLPQAVILPILAKEHWKEARSL